MVSTAMAQITTSGLSGSVTASGEDVIGATIEAVHVPSGTRYKAVTNIDGMFTINGMRVVVLTKSRSATSATRLRS